MRALLITNIQGLLNRQYQDHWNAELIIWQDIRLYIGFKVDIKGKDVSESIIRLSFFHF